jgi:hypothetical protein
MVLGSTPNFKLGTFDHSVIYPVISYRSKQVRWLGLRRFERLLEPS